MQTTSSILYLLQMKKKPNINENGKNSEDPTQPREPQVLCVHKALHTLNKALRSSHLWRTGCQRAEGSLKAWPNTTKSSTARKDRFWVI